MKRHLLVMILTTFGLLLPRHLFAQQEYKTVSVCQALHLGVANRESNVEISANVVSDGRHGTILTDERCPGEGLLVDVLPSGADPSVAEFEKALWSAGSPGTTGRKVSGTFYGKLLLDRKTKDLSISIVRVKDLRNVPKGQGSP